MPISLEQIIKEGNISPLHWGMNGKDIAHRLSHSYQLIQRHRQANYPFLDLEGVELYFRGDLYQELYQLIIQVWRIRPKARKRFFGVAWLHNKLTYDKVLGNLKRVGWHFTAYTGSQKEPVLLVEDRALFRFYDIPEPNGAYLLCKVVVLCPQDTQFVIDELGKLPYEMIQSG
ncbi:hypothetical protein [Hymenobacter metallilatus]|uniref:Uncharacterized protein n=1 Tax=Hymenobacter metallilatus TaxID=2493666 RepID=A0A428JMM2_9BACT|nr:hypothetical protein [Hymenobacter metallilatus]RSK34464.1 hypothetical protein EI290_07480 [Hymenobacter metallilatus]